MTTEYPEILICPICKRVLNQLNKQHIKNHNMSINDFQILYPNYPLVNLQRHQSLQAAALIRSKKSYKTTAVANRLFNINEAKKREIIYLKSPNHCNNCNTILPYKRKKRKYCDNPECKKIAVSIGHKHVSTAGKQKQIDILNKHRYKTFNIDFIATHPIFNSKGQLELMSLIQKQFPQYNWQSGGHFNIGNKLYKSLDIYCKVNNLIIEYDGIYHFKNVYGNLERVQMKDKQLELFCQNTNWKLIRINEKTFLNKKDECLNIIYNMINNYETIDKINKIYLLSEI